MCNDRFGQAMVAAIALAMTASLAWADDDDEEEVLEYDEANVYIEINATDGDAGLHGIFDADAWEETEIKNEGGDTVLEVEADGALREQGMTETFFESAEPLCDNTEEPDERRVTLGEFLARFPEGTYTFEGETIEGDDLEGQAELTHNLPAAPIITHFNGHVVSWTPGFDLGECSEEGIVPAPSEDTVAWEVAVEPADDEAFDPLRVLSVQLGPDARHLVIPPQFVNSYPVGTAFKVEVGAIEASGNRTFSELSLEEED